MLDFLGSELTHENMEAMEPWVKKSVPFTDTIDNHIRYAEEVGSNYKGRPGPKQTAFTLAQEVKRLRELNADISIKLDSIPNTYHNANAAMVITWARSPNRSPANVAFPEGPERQAAFWVEFTEQQFGRRAQPIQ